MQTLKGWIRHFLNRVKRANGWKWAKGQHESGLPLQFLKSFGKQGTSAFDQGIVDYVQWKEAKNGQRT